MPIIARVLTASVAVLSFAVATPLFAQTPAPPVKPGLWETKMTQLDASGKEVPAPEFAAFSRMAPEMRARMAEIMRGRGVQMPDANGVIKVCLTPESLNTGAWQQVAAESGCTTTYSARSNSTWKWHTSCAGLKSESDGETVFNGSVGYRTKFTSTVNVQGKPTTSTRIVQGTWVSAACGDVKPLTPPPARGK